MSLVCWECDVSIGSGSFCDNCLRKWREVNRWCPTCHAFGWVDESVDIYSCPEHGQLPAKTTTCPHPACDKAQKDRDEPRLVKCTRCKKGRLTPAQWAEAKAQGELE